MHPYKTAPETSFWSRSVSRNYDPVQMIKPVAPLVKPGERIASAGSCFASNIVRYLEDGGFTYLRTEEMHSSMRTTDPENLGYDEFSAAYGNVYTARQLLQLLRRALDKFRPEEDRWFTEAGVVDPFRPGLRYPAQSEREFEILNRQHLHAVRQVFANADVFIFTLGLTEGWVSRADGAVFPACPGVISGTFDPMKHAFHNFDASEVIADLAAFVHELRTLNPTVRLILTVSPVPLVATATGSHVVAATTYSKSVLRVAAEQITSTHKDVTYFPAFEIVTGPQAPQSYFEPNRRSVSVEAVDEVMRVFLAHCERQGEPGPMANASPVDFAAQMSKRITDAECEEVMMDR